MVAPRWLPMLQTLILGNCDMFGKLPSLSTQIELQKVKLMSFAWLQQL
jgi:hypothetical protein